MFGWIFKRPAIEARAKQTDEAREKQWAEFLAEEKPKKNKGGCIEGAHCRYCENCLQFINYKTLWADGVSCDATIGVICLLSMPCKKFADRTKKHRTPY